ncbi:hypothetical protein [Rathayibacter agropyri]|uniref:hypothetical protein n=1 Tax=Rathayibacter agropyri TaxID=1634927 RepID=UPI0015636599|nr:hypothetical protein [Rathayibacter agropyri]NRD10089.1 hypothetical protein [Rathayibacter agropyri]
MTDQPTTASINRILRGKVPTFIAQRSARHMHRLPEVFDALIGEHGKKLGVGTAMKMWGNTETAIDSYFSSVDTVPLRIADPVLFRHPLSIWEGMETTSLVRKDPTFAFYNALPNAVDPAWIHDVIHAQYRVGATVALSATGWVGTTNAAAALDQAMLIVQESRTVVGDGAMFVNLTMDKEWLINRELRNLLLREIVESNEQHWYLRFWWPESANSYGQLADPDILRGYRTLATTAAVEDKKLFLANSSLTGWLMGAFGATGFSTGASATDQTFARVRRMGRRPGQTPPKEIARIFDRFLLHTMDATVFDRLRALPGHRDFRTRFLDEIDADGHSKPVAGLHYLNAVGNLQAKMRAADRAVVAHRAIDRGLRWVDGLAQVDKPAGANSPIHLPIWQTIR